MSSAKKLQNKIFGTPSSSSANLGVKASPSDPGLTINIPKPSASVTNLNTNKERSNATPNAYTKSHPAAAPRNYRDKITTQLGADYESVERYRLLQDERKERHWKRWGPYLSERQWVRIKL